MAGRGRPRTDLGTAGNTWVTPQRRNAAGKWETCDARQAERWQAGTWHRDFDGESRKVTKTAGTKAAAQAALKRALTVRETPSGVVQGYKQGTLVRDAADLWVSSIRLPSAGLSARSVDQYTRTVRNHVHGSTIAALTLREVNVVSVIQGWLQSVADSTGEGAAKTARTVIQNVLNAAVMDRALPYNAARDTRPAKPSQARQTVRDTSRALTVKEREHLIRTADKHPAAQRQDVADVLAYMAGTGVRIGEALAQRWEDVDLDARTVKVRGTKTAGSVRTIHLPSWLADRLVNRAKLHGATGVVFHSPGFKDLRVRNNPDLQPSRENPRDARNVARIMRQVMDAAGLEWATPHTLRRTVASVADKAGRPIQEIAAHLGHADPSMTMRVYLDRHHSPEGMADVL